VVLNPSNIVIVSSYTGRGIGARMPEFVCVVLYGVDVSFVMGRPRWRSPQHFEKDSVVSEVNSDSKQARKVQAING